MQITKKNFTTTITSPETLLWGLVILAFFFSIFAFTIGWQSPIIDFHAFRQTQTALSAFWMLKEGYYFYYQTPVLGYPWNIPLEFPLYQWLVIVVYKLTNLGLDQCGRLVSILAFYAILFPMYVLLKRLNFKITVFKIFTCLFLLSPLYLFWSRTFMIESLGLFLAISFLALTQEYLSEKKALTAIVCIVCGCAGALVKITTFVPAALFCVGLVLMDWYKNYSCAINKKTMLRYAITVLFGLIPFAVTLLWVGYTDHVKAAHPIGSFLTAKALMTWNFGTIAQRFSSQLWIKTIFERSLLTESLGYGLPFFILFVYVCGRKEHVKQIAESANIKFALFSLAICFSAFLIFTNLHIEHNYYNYENTLYLILAAAVVLYVISRKISPVFFVLLMLIIMAVQIKTYDFTYRRLAAANTVFYRDYLVALFVREHTKPNDFILVHGVDWSSTIAYYSERKSLTRDLSTAADFVERLENINKYSGGLRLGAIVLCPPKKIRASSKETKILSQLLQKYTVNIVANCVVCYLPANNKARYTSYNRIKNET